MLSTSQQFALVAAASRAPSPHNIQPARWRFVDESIELYEDPRRWLSAGDPSGKDNRIALGAAWEGMSLALSSIGLRFADSPDVQTLAYPPTSSIIRLVCAAIVEPGETPEPLATMVNARRSHRQIFRAATPAEQAKLAALIARSECAMSVNEKSAVFEIARLYDDAATMFIRDPAFVRELVSWMRLSSSVENFNRDGLNADCLALSSAEAFAARYVMRPAVIRAICALRLERLLVSEAAKTRSATALVLFHVPSDQPQLDTGRAYYRLWLQLTQAGFGAVPMSALVDSPKHATQLLALQPLPAGRCLMAVFRVGPADSATAESARLPVRELIIP